MGDLGLSDRAVLAASQVEMEMRGGGVMTARRFGQVAAGWAAEGDGGDVLAEVWSRLVDAAGGCSS